MRVAASRSTWQLTLPVVASLLTGCTGALPDPFSGAQRETAVTAPPPQLAAPGVVGAPVPPATQAPAPPALVAGPATASPVGQPSDVVLIMSFTKPTVVLYSGEASNDGERVATSSLPTPLRGRVASGNTARLEIQTPSGPRWLARSEVALSSQAIR